MRLYSVQSEQDWDAAQRRGYLTGGTSRPELDEHFKRGYEFMRQAMAARLPAYSGDYPVWAWLKRPDLREWRHLVTTPSVLLTFEVPTERTLPSRFNAFHFVLNGWYLSLTEAEDEAISNGPPLTAAMLEASWQRIFDLTPPTDPAQLDWCGAYSDADVQVCIDRVLLPEVQHVRPFLPAAKPAHS